MAFAQTPTPSTFRFILNDPNFTDINGVRAWAAEFKRRLTNYIFCSPDSCGGGGGGGGNVDWKLNASTIISGAIANINEPDLAVLTNSPAGTAKLDLSKYALLPGRNGGQRLIGSNVDDGNIFHTLLFSASNSGILGFAGPDNAPIGIIVGDDVTKINGFGIPLLFPMSGVTLDASAASVQFGVVGMVSFSPWLITDDTNGIKFDLYQANLAFQSVGNKAMIGTSFSSTPNYIADGGFFNLGHNIGLTSGPVLSTTGAPGSFAAIGDSIAVNDEPTGASNTAFQARYGVFMKTLAAGSQEFLTAVYVQRQDVAPLAGFSVFSTESNMEFFNAGHAQIGDVSQATTTLASNFNPGDTTITLTSSVNFAASGFVLMLGRPYVYTANNTGTGVLTLASQTTFSGNAGDTVTQYTQPAATMEVWTNDGAIPALDINLISSSSGMRIRNNLGNSIFEVDTGGRVVVQNGDIAVGDGVSTIVAAVGLTSQAGSLGPVTLFTPIADGVFRISSYVFTLNNGNPGSNVVTSFDWTDDAQAQTITASTVDLGTIGDYKETTTVIEVKASNPITYTTVFTSTGGSPHYNFYVTVERLA